MLFFWATKRIALLKFSIKYKQLILSLEITQFTEIHSQVLLFHNQSVNSADMKCFRNVNTLQKVIFKPKSFFVFCVAGAKQRGMTSKCNKK